MEKNKIGLNAGKVWHVLNKAGKLSVFELCRRVGLAFEDVVLAVGWLARESKITIKRKDEMLFISIEKGGEHFFG